MREANAPRDEPQYSGKVKWTIKDLPRGVKLEAWKFLYVPRFLDYFGTYGEPWEASNYVAIAQQLWDATFDTVHVLSLKDEPVYPLVRHFYCLRDFELI